MRAWPVGVVVLLVVSLLGEVAVHAEPPAIQRRVHEVIDRVSPSVVSITAIGPPPIGFIGEPPTAAEDPSINRGSGVIISADGEVLTCEHVTSGARRYLVHLADGRRLPASLVGRDVEGDVALLRIDAPGPFPHAELGLSAELRIGDLVLAFGNPFELAWDGSASVSLGVVSGLDRFQMDDRIYGAAIQTDAALNPGSSGGPLVDLQGRVVGLGGRISTRGEEPVNRGIGLAIPSDQIRLYLDALRAGGPVRHGFLGVRFRAGNGQDGGVEIIEVIPGSAAEEAGLQPGDHIMLVNGRHIDGAERLQNVISILPAGVTVRLRLTRGPTVRDIDVVLGARPAR